MSFQYCVVDDVKRWLAGLDVSEMPSSLDLIIQEEYIPWAKREIDMFVGENFDLTTTNEFYDGTSTPELILRHRPITFIRKAILRIIPSIEWFEFRRPFHLNTIDQTGVTIAQRGGVEPIDAVVQPPYTFDPGSTVPADLIGLPKTADFNNTTEQFERADLFVNCKLGVLTIPPRILFLENQGVPYWNYTWLQGYATNEIEYDYGYKDLETLPQEIRSACAKLAAASVLNTKGLFAGSGAVSLSIEGVSKSFTNTLYGGHIAAYVEGARQSLRPYQRHRV